MGNNADMAVKVAIVIIAAVMLSSVAFINGYPLLDSDTIGYLRNGRIVAEYFSSLTVEQEARPGRSIFYSYFVHLLEVNHSLWPVVISQSFIISFILYIIFRIACPESTNSTFLAVIGLLVLTSSVAWFIGKIMPDIFTSTVILCAYLLTFCRKQLNKVNYIFLIILFTASILFHSSNLLIAVAMVIIIAVTAKIAGHSVRELFLQAVPLIIGIFLAVIFSIASSLLIAGRAQIAAINSPPFVLARLLEDGTARAYLEQNCTRERFALCRFVRELPTTAHSFLWGDDKRFQKAAPPDEEKAIVWATIKTYPIWQLRCSIGHFFEQLLTFGIDASVNVKQYPAWEREFTHLFAAYKQSLQFDRRLILRSASSMQYASVLVAIAICIYMIARHPELISPDIRVLSIMIVAGLVANAAITGPLSTVASRYESRIIWLLVFLGLL